MAWATNGSNPGTVATHLMSVSSSSARATKAAVHRRVSYVINRSPDLAGHRHRIRKHKQIRHVPLADEYVEDGRRIPADAVAPEPTRMVLGQPEDLLIGRGLVRRRTRVTGVVVWRRVEAVRQEDAFHGSWKKSNARDKRLWGCWNKI